MILSLFIDVKSIQVISGSNLKRMKKIARSRCGTKISKTNLKTMISPLLTCPQGCQKIQMTKHGFFDNFCSILMGFHSFFNFDWILVLQLTKVVFCLIFWIFRHPWHSWGHVNNGDIIVLRFVFDIFVLQRHLVIFFILFKLKLDITCIDLTSIKSDNITF